MFPQIEDWIEEGRPSEDLHLEDRSVSPENEKKQWLCLRILVNSKRFYLKNGAKLLSPLLTRWLSYPYWGSPLYVLGHMCRNVGSRYKSPGDHVLDYDRRTQLSKENLPDSSGASVL